MLETTDELEKVIRYLESRREAAWIGVDTETTTPNPVTARLVGIALSAEDKRGIYVPVGHAYGPCLPMEETLEMLAPLLARDGMIASNGRFDVRMFEKYGVEMRLSWDSQSMSRLLGEVEYGIGLKDTVYRMFGELMLTYADVAGDNSFSLVEVGRASTYAVPDAVYCRRVVRQALRTLRTDPDLIDTEVWAMREAARMETHGVPLDMDFVDRNIETGLAMADVLRTETVEGLRYVAKRQGANPKEIPEDLNLRSHKQMKRALFEICKFQPQRFTKKGAPSLDKAAIELLAEQEPEVDFIRRYRSCMARVGDLREMKKYSAERDGWWWIHANMNPTGTVTGRWSSSQPNMQNKRKGVSTYKSSQASWDIVIRDAIRAPAGYYLVTADYSQIELRVAAGESGCRKWLDAFDAGEDVHAASGAAIAQVLTGHPLAVSEVSKEQRMVGKTFNFALLFGQEVENTAKKLNVSLAEGKRMQDAFWEGLPEVQSWMEEVKQFAKRNHYVETRLGRRRWLRDLGGGSNPHKYAKALREAVNMVVQGGAADLMKLGMRAGRPAWTEAGGELFLVVHDQYVWMLPKGIPPEEFIEAVRPHINVQVDGYPEIVSDFGWGESFGSLTAYGEESASEEATLVVEVDTVTKPAATAFAEMVTEAADDAGPRLRLLVTSTGREWDLGRTGLGVDDLMKIRATLERSARVYPEMV